MNFQTNRARTRGKDRIGGIVQEVDARTRRILAGATGGFGEIGASGHHNSRAQVFNLLALDRIRILGQKNCGWNRPSVFAANATAAP